MYILGKDGIIRDVPESKMVKWKINHAGLERAKKELGIKNDVKVRRTSAEGRLGRCVSLPTEHRITADKFVEKEEAVKILLHELRHAWQFEQVLEKSKTLEQTYSTWKWMCSERRYRDRAIEIDAREAEEKYREFMDLVESP